MQQVEQHETIPVNDVPAVTDAQHDLRDQGVSLPRRFNFLGRSCE